MLYLAAAKQMDSLVTSSILLAQLYNVYYNRNSSPVSFFNVVIM